MSATIISGKEIAGQIRAELKADVARMKADHGVVPGLVTILVGENPASISYVTAKQKTSHELDFHSIQDSQPEKISEDDLLKLI
ncbi:MAG: bifunctional 5,10-methylene-tetrahydrofolate dehydrogenase/5,10-methylene-tetrahydrofolate cyclohydrolase, partial [Deltaproteobacteria bacterium]|nr:bifunctional 5,10-methylene-tetrahydrofolate dehydrogenase/5,10-methylene-tetrahydrofolate cyclohydrolase [Deltaproteobacteria bacterium]